MKSVIIALLLVSTVFATTGSAPEAANCFSGDTAGRCVGCKTNTFVIEEDTAATTGKFSIPKCGLVAADKNVAVGTGCNLGWPAVRNKGTTTINAGDLTQDPTALKGNKVFMEKGVCFLWSLGKVNQAGAAAATAPVTTAGTTKADCARSYRVFTDATDYTKGRESCLACSATSKVKIAASATVHDTCVAQARTGTNLVEYENKAGNKSPTGCDSTDVVVPINADLFHVVTDTSVNACKTRTSATGNTCSVLTNCSHCHFGSSTTTPKCWRCDVGYQVSPNDYKCYNSFTAAAAATTATTAAGSRAGIVAFVGLFILALFN